MTKINGSIDARVIHAPSLRDLAPGDRFTQAGQRHEYTKIHKNGVWHWSKGLDYPHEISLWSYNAEVDWLDN